VESVVIILLGIVAMLISAKLLLGQERQIPPRLPSVDIYAYEMADSTTLTCAVATLFNEISIDCDWGDR